MNSKIKELIRFAEDVNDKEVESAINFEYWCARNNDSSKKTMEVDFCDRLGENVFEFSTKTSPNCTECSEILLVSFPEQDYADFWMKYPTWVSGMMEICEPSFGTHFNNGVFITLIWTF